MCEFFTLIQSEHKTEKLSFNPQSINVKVLRASRFRKLRDVVKLEDGFDSELFD